MTRPDTRQRFASQNSRKDKSPTEPAALALIPKTVLAPDQRRRLLQKAQLTGTSIDEIILCDHLMSEEIYYGLIAQKLGLDFSTMPLKVIAPFRITDAWRSRMVRLNPAHNRKQWLLAPKGRDLERLLTQKLTSNEGFSNLVITTPTALFRSLADSKTEFYTHYFATYLHDKKPDLSCHSLCHDRFARIAPFIVLPLCALLLQLLEFSLSQAATFLLLPVLGIRIALIATRPAAAIPPPALSDKDLPFYSILVPLYREGMLVTQLVDSFTALDYPAPKREVLFLIEEDDLETRNALAQKPLPYGFHVLILPNGLPRTKPRALNVGLASATGSLIVVYDAEDRPHPQQLREAARLFAHYGPQTACLQASLVIDNLHESPLAHLFALEYAGLFDVILPRQATKQWPVPLGGSSNHFRRDCLSAALGWDAWNVTEDADLGLRLARLGYQIAHLPSLTFEDAPTTFKDWFMQRRRWIKGWIMTAVVHLRHPVQLFKESGGPFFAVFVSQCLGLIGAILFWPFTLIGIPALLYARTLSAAELVVMLMPFLCALPSILWPLVKGAQIRGHRLPLWIYLALPFYFLLMTVAGWVSLFDYIFKPHHWNKTPHKPHSP